MQPQNGNRTPTQNEQAWMALIAIMVTVFAVFGCIMVFLFSNLPQRVERETGEDIEVGDEFLAEATAEATDSVFLQVEITPTPLFAAQSGDFSTPVWVPTQAAPVWQPTPFPTWTPPIVTEVPTWIPPMATPVPQPLPPVLNTLPMPPLNVAEPMCSFNPIYIGFDPRVGCRMPVGESIINAELILNGTPVSMALNFGWQYASQPLVAQPGQMLIWATANNMTCIAWNPSIPLGTSDAVSVRLYTNMNRTVEGLIIVHQAYVARTAMNPHPAAHACGYSPDRTYLRAEIGDSLHRFMLALDIIPSDYLWNAWYAMHGSYDLVAGQTYAVPPEWTGGLPIYGK
jgi:hypothetical protein